MALKIFLSVGHKDCFVVQNKKNKPKNFDVFLYCGWKSVEILLPLEANIIWTVEKEIQ
jgi:hypothetical protein